MEIKSTHRQKLKLRYFEKSLRFPLTFVYLIIFAIVLFQKIYSEYGLESLPSAELWIMGGGIAMFLLIEIIEWLAYPKKPNLLIGLVLTGIRIVLYYFITLIDPTGITSSLVGYILFTMCFYFHPILVLPVLLLVLWVFYGNIPLFWTRPDLEIGFVYELFSFIVFYLFGIIIRLDDRTRLRNMQMVRQLESYAFNSISLGKQAERDRISRDLHDSLGHQLVAVNIQLQKSVAYREIDAGESLEAINKAQDATNEAIKELRQTIKDLREFEELTSFEEELEKIIQQKRENGLEISCEIIGNVKAFPEFTLLTLKQVIQESLTNVEKHAQAKQTSVVVNFQRKKVRASIKDDGIGFNVKKSKKEGHFGLQGMQERLDIIGGKLTIRSKPETGTEVIIEIPKDIYG
jgi:signal transduction histidine kinase